MPLAPPHGIDAVKACFGDPEAFILDDGRVSHAWEAQILGRARLPFPLFLSWVPGRAVTSIACHRLLIPIVEATFNDLAFAGFGPNRPLTPAGNRINEYGGCYAWRSVRGSARSMSMHCFAIAIDLDPDENKRGETPQIDPEVVEIMESRGFHWGGRFRIRDGMHFQYCTGC